MATRTIVIPTDETRTGTRERTSTHRLPDTMLSEQVQRLAICAAVGAGLWTYGLVMDTLVRPATLGVPMMPLKLAIEIGAILTSALMFVYVRYAPFTPSVKTDVGLGYLVINAIGVAALNTLNGMGALPSAGYLSWTAVVILVGAMIIPAPPRKMLAGALVAATMDPLALWVAHQQGTAVPSVVNTFVLFMPNYACALVATLPSRILHRLGRRLRHAQAMGSYHLVELLGRGGMGEVWRARHRLLARTAAIKLVRPELLGANCDAEAREMLRRFEREAQATATLSSPHTIRLYDFGITSDRTFYYVMELLAGRDLSSLVREFGPLPAERVIFLLRQVCHSLADAHARGIIHRDVTLSNIYVCRMGLDYDFVKVLDFGLVKFSDKGSASDTHTTRARATTGTPAFMAPEVIVGAAFDQRADVYALGCVMYHLLTGHAVFAGETPMKIFLQHLDAAPVPPSERTELPVPADLERLVLACLDKHPDRRPRDAADVLQRLNRCRPREAWTSEHARVWWERHLKELAGPITRAGSRVFESAVA